MVVHPRRAGRQRPGSSTAGTETGCYKCGTGVPPVNSAGTETGRYKCGTGVPPVNSAGTKPGRYLPRYSQRLLHVSCTITAARSGRLGASRCQIQRANTSDVGFSNPSISLR